MLWAVAASISRRPTGLHHRGVPYQDLGAAHLDTSTVHEPTRRLEALGLRVQIKPATCTTVVLSQARACECASRIARRYCEKVHLAWTTRGLEGVARALGTAESVLLSGVRATFAILVPPQQNLWRDFGSGSFPSV
jgi:hypothetical protein